VLFVIHDCRLCSTILNSWMYLFEVPSSFLDFMGGLMGGLMGVSWGSHGGLMGVSWGSHGGLMGVSWWLLGNKLKYGLGNLQEVLPKKPPVIQGRKSVNE
jgi:hypothetical protein